MRDRVRETALAVVTVLKRLAPGRRNPVAVFLRALSRLLERDMSLVAAGMSFFALLAIFPAIVVLASLFGLLFEPTQIARQLDTLTELLPEGSRALIRTQIDNLVGRPIGSLSAQGMIALVVSLWSSTRGLKGLIAGLNVLRGERTVRGFLGFHLFGLILTAGAFGMAFLISFISAVVPPLVDELGLGEMTTRDSPVWRWGPTAVAVFLSLSVVYRYDRPPSPVPWRWAMLGAVLAMAFWLLMTFGFSAYVRHVTYYAEIYGTLGGVVVFLLWLYVSSYALLLGGALVAELEYTYAPDGDTDPAAQSG